MIGYVLLAPNRFSEQANMGERVVHVDACVWHSWIGVWKLGCNGRSYPGLP